jgi:hypothetical protein
MKNDTMNYQLHYDKWAGGFKWKYHDGYVPREGKPYKKRVSTKKTFASSTINISINISKAVKGGRWYNDGTRDFWISKYATEAGADLTNLVPGRINMKKQNKNN